MEVRLRIDGIEHLVKFQPGADVTTVDGVDVPVRALDNGRGPTIEAAGRVHAVTATSGGVVVDGNAVRVEIVALSGGPGAGEGAGAVGPIHPPMPGRIDQVLVARGDRVQAGQVLFVLEAMKMRNEVKAAADAVVAAVHVAAGANVEPGDVVIDLAAPDG